MESEQKQMLTRGQKAGVKREHRDGAPGLVFDELRAFPAAEQSRMTALFSRAERLPFPPAEYHRSGGMFFQERHGAGSLRGLIFAAVYPVSVDPVGMLPWTLKLWGREATEVLLSFVRSSPSMRGLRPDCYGSPDFMLSIFSALSRSGCENQH